MNPGVDQYLAEGCMRCELGGTPQCKVHYWTNQLKLLRRILLDCGLIEEIKWSMPCYTYNGANILIMSAFKDYCSLIFFKGVLIPDTKNLLEKPGENTRGARLMKFTDIERIHQLESVIKAYIYEAIEVEKSGQKVDYETKKELELPDELESMMTENPDLKNAFYALTPGRQRGYILHFSQPKQTKTRISRIEKCIPKIMDGKGFHDR